MHMHIFRSFYTCICIIYIHTYILFCERMYEITLVTNAHLRLLALQV